MNSANYNAYGDESYFGDIATYAIIGIEREKVATVENVIFSKSKESRPSGPGFAFAP